MAKVEYAGVSCELKESESALDGLLRAGAAVPHSCKAGICGSCLLRAENPEALPARSQAGLKDSWRANGYFLACVCYPERDLAAGPLGADARVAARIVSIACLSENVVRVQLIPEAPFAYRPGQYITLFRGAGSGEIVSRSYSLASLEAEGTLDLHVRVLPNGRMSQWLAIEARPGDEVQIQGPSGECFYVGGQSAQPLILAGTGTGLAPLYGIAREALRQEHTGPIHLFHGALDEAGLYLQPELEGLAAAHGNFTYTSTTRANDGPIDQFILGRFPKPAGSRAFLCGDAAIVQSLKKKLYLAGVPLRDIHADAFLPSV